MVGTCSDDATQAWLCRNMPPLRSEHGHQFLGSCRCWLRDWWTWRVLSWPSRSTPEVRSPTPIFGVEALRRGLDSNPRSTPSTLGVEGLWSTKNQGNLTPLLTSFFGPSNFRAETWSFPLPYLKFLRKIRGQIGKIDPRITYGCFSVQSLRFSWFVAATRSSPNQCSSTRARSLGGSSLMNSFARSSLAASTKSSTRPV